MMSIRRARDLMVCSLGVVAMTLVAGCGDTTDGKGESDGASSDQIVFWDPFTRHIAGSDWDKLIKSCAPEGMEVVRSSAPQTDLFNQLTTAVREGNAPDVVLLDNPMMPEAATAGLLATADEAGIVSDGLDKNLTGPGVVDGVTYGIPFGSNALGLYYNADILEKAGVDPASIKDWDSLNAAIEKVVSSGSKGITFSGVAGEEGVFQFLPWYWGGGADLEDIASEKAVSAGNLISTWIGKGWAPKSAVTDNQTVSWDLFSTGEYGFAENGSWFASAAAEADGFKVGVVPIPSAKGGLAPVPTGGEFAVAPVQKNDAKAHYANAAKMISCLTSEKSLETNETLGYLSANPDVRAQQVAASPLWEPWVPIVEGANGRTTDVGAEYVGISGMLSEAVQGSINAAGDAAAVKQAFEAAAGK